MRAPTIYVGILTRKAITFTFNQEYVMVENGAFLKGEQRAILIDGKIVFNGKMYNQLFFEPTSPNATFDLQAVTIGVDFHWQQQEDQRFQGALEITPSKEGLVAINHIDLEQYLTCVIASEMNARSPREFLKAHAVISRSWVLAQIEKKRKQTEHPQSCFRDNEKLIRWYDREDHTHFDVCADDHCQRYQGITRASTDIVRQAIAATRGQVLTSEGNICDARFSKCCGGIFEEFQYCWEDTRRPYLAKQRDYLAGSGKLVSKLPDLTQEAEADRWIRTSPESFCNTTDKKILSQVLNNYDQETTDFYRWKVEYTQDELSALILKRSGVDYGRIIDLVPVARGTSGRLWKLKIVGTKKTRTIGKELEIRRTLSPSHLYSSAFVIDRAELSAEGIPGRFILTGAGWGHGVGLCQIGAAVMGEQGYQYDAILLHYYTGATIDKLYD